MYGCKCCDGYDPDDGRYHCAVTGDDCFFLMPNKACAEQFGFGEDPEAEVEDSKRTLGVTDGKGEGLF